MKTRIGVIRVLTTNDEAMLNAHGRLLEQRFPEFETVSRCIGDQPEGLYDEATHAMALPKIIKLGQEMAREAFQAIIVSCADDPGVKELRELLKIPVIGAGSACAGLALACGARIGTLGISGGSPKAMRDTLGPHLVAEAKPAGVVTTLDLQTDEGKSNALRAAEYLKKAGAEVIALACTGFSTIGIAGMLGHTVGLPVIDAAEAAGSVARQLTRPDR